MKILRYEADGDARYGILEEDDSIRQLVGSPFGDFAAGDEVAQLDQVRVLAPVAPDKVIGVGLNYKDHIEESGKEPPAFPMLFMKPSTAVIGPEEPIVYPPEGERVDYEVELVAVIGREARRVSERGALDYVLGYTCGNDVSARNIQLPEMAMGTLLIGKGFDTFCPLGPVIATGLDPTNIEVMTRLNGEERQRANTSNLLFSVANLVSYISQAITLEPGDVILTGTPEGVGPMQPGDVCEIEIDGVGVLRNSVVGEGD